MEQSISRRSFLGMTAAAGAALALTGLGTVPGATVAKADDGSYTLIIRMDGDPMSFNPDCYADDTFYPAAINLFSRLVKLDLASNILPDAAETWEVSDDGLTITFNLRHDLVWSDGEALTAEDAAYTFETIRANSAYFFCSYLSNVESVEATDDYTVVFHMTTPDVSLVTNLGWYANFIMPKHIYDVEGVAWGDNEAASLSHPDKVVCSGPYRISEYKQGQNLLLVANENSPVQPAIKSINYSVITDATTAVQAILNAEIDLYSNAPAANVPEMEASADVDVASQAKAVPLRIVFSFDTELGADSAFRHAVAMCVDRTDICKKVEGGTMPADYSMFPPVIEWACNTEDLAPDVDLAAAEQCLIDAGYTKGSDGYYVSGLTIDTFDFGGLPDMAKLIIANMKQIGIGVELNLLESNAWSDKCFNRKDFTICMMGGTMAPDPSSLATRYSTGGSGNIGNWSNAEFDALVTEANSEGDSVKRADLYKQAQAIMAEELPIVPIADWTNFIAYANIFKNLPIATVTEDGQAVGEYEMTYADFA